MRLYYVTGASFTTRAFRAKLFASPDCAGLRFAKCEKPACPRSVRPHNNICHRMTGVWYIGLSVQSPVHRAGSSVAVFLTSRRDGVRALVIRVSFQLSGIAGDESWRFRTRFYLYDIIIIMASAVNVSFFVCLGVYV